MPINHSDQKNPASRNAGDSVVLNFLEGIFATQAEEIQCDQAAIEIVRCADRKLDDEAARKRYPAMFHHFRYCRNCAEEYAMVTDFVRQEAAGLVHRPAYIPPPPAYAPLPVAGPAGPEVSNEPATASETGFAAAVRGVARWLSEALSPMQPALVRSRRLGEKPEKLLMEGEEVTVTLTLKQDPSDPHMRRLVCIVETTNDELEAAFESAPIQLRREKDGELVQERMLNESGDVTFTGVTPGAYALQWSLAGQDFMASGLEIS